MKNKFGLLLNFYDHSLLALLVYNLPDLNVIRISDYGDCNLAALMFSFHLTISYFFSGVYWTIFWKASSRFASHGAECIYPSTGSERDINILWLEGTRFIKHDVIDICFILFWAFYSFSFWNLCMKRDRGWRTFKRPGVDAFLEHLAKFYEIVVYSDQLNMVCWNKSYMLWFFWFCFMYQWHNWQYLASAVRWSICWEVGPKPLHKI